MDRLEYLEEHHQLTESIIGLVSIQTDIEGVKKVLDVWRPKLHEVIVKRTKQVCIDQNVPWDEIKSLFSFAEEN